MKNENNNTLQAKRTLNKSKDYGKWIGEMDWNYMVTIRKNYKTNSNVVRKVANHFIQSLESIETAVYVGEKDSIDDNNYHIHILINSTSKDIMKDVIEYKKRNKADTVYVEPIKDNYSAGMYISKHFNITSLVDRDIVWDFFKNN